jgi:hypothetical protein
MIVHAGSTSWQLNIGMRTQKFVIYEMRSDFYFGGC